MGEITFLIPHNMCSRKEISRADTKEHLQYTRNYYLYVSRVYRSVVLSSLIILIIINSSLFSIIFQLLLLSHH